MTDNGFARPDDRSLDELIERYWDAIVSGVPAGPEAAQLDPTLAQTVWRARAMDDAPPIDPRFQQRLWEDLMHGYANTVPLRLPPRSIAVNGRGNGRTHLPARVDVRRPRPHYARQVIATLGLVALLVVTLGGVYTLYRGEHQPAFIPATQASPTAAATPAENWPMYRGDPGRSGSLPVTGPTTAPVELWRYQTGGQIDAAPAIVGGVLYVASEDGKVYAIDAATGAVVWTAAMAEGSGAGVVVEDGIVYVTDHTSRLYAFDAATGSERWHHDGVGETDPGPVVDGVITSGGSDGALHALDATDGEERWSTPLGGGASRATAYADGLLVVGSQDGHINGLDAASGALRWSVDLRGGTVGTPAIVGGVVYAANFGGPDNKLVALNAVDGSEVWRYQTAARADLRSPAVGGGMVYTVSGDGNLYALDAATGTERFHIATGGPITAAPALASGVVYFVSHDFTIYAADATNGTVLWAFDYGSATDYGPVVAGGNLYLGTNSGLVIAVGGRSGAADGSPVADGKTTTTPAFGADPVSSATQVASVGTSDSVAYIWATTNASTTLGEVAQIAAEPDGTLFVADTGNQRVAIFAADGTYLGDVQTEAQQPFGQLNGIAVDPQGRLYVADSQRKDVRIFDEKGGFLSAWPGTSGAPTLMQVDARGNLWFADFDRANIVEFDANGGLVTTFGEYGSGDGQLVHPNSVAVDAAGNAYVTECDNHRVSKFGPDGVFVTSWDHDFTCLATIVLDGNGHVFVCDPGNHRIQVFDTDGTFLTMWGSGGTGEGQFDAPTSLALDGLGNVYVGDIAEGRVQKFRLLPPLVATNGDSAGPATPVTTSTRPTFAWAARGSGEQMLQTPLDVAVAPDGKVWVADVPGEFKIFDAKGNFLETWGTTGSDPGQFRFTDPSNTGAWFAFAPDGTLYVADMINDRIEHFDQDRRLLGTFGSKGTGDGLFSWSGGIAFEPDGSLLVADLGQGGIQHFAPDGTFLDRWDATGTPGGPFNGLAGIALDGQGRLIVVENVAARVRVFDRDRKEVATLDISGQQPPVWNNAVDVAVDASGAIYVADQNNRLIRVFGADLHFIYQWGITGEGEARLVNPGWIGLGPGGAVYVTDVDSARLVRFNLSGNTSASPSVSAAGATPEAQAAAKVEPIWETTGDPSNPLRQPDDIAIDPHGTLWVTDARGEFQLFDLDGTYLETWGTPGSGDGQFNFVRKNGDNYGGVAFGTDGSFYVVDTGNLRVQKFDQARTFVASWGGRGTGDGQFLEPLSIAIDGQGLLYVLDDLRDDVQVFDGSGAFVRKFRVHEALGFATNLENSSNLIAVDGAGNVYVTSVLRSSVLKFDPSGKLLGEIGGPGNRDGEFGQPDGIAVDGAGNVYVTDSQLNRVEVFAADGTYRLQWGESGADPGQFNAPTGIAVRGQYVYVAEYSGNRVQKFRLTGM